MATEIIDHVLRPKTISREAMMKADMWSLGKV